ncbi:hypothetical protein DFS34DRAFT_267126 [Phlyctochytrium arcticum]|nr:hypothetical protein DFS34DRAFT_267126 [Phlyctochytrium arcticum]
MPKCGPQQQYYCSAASVEKWNATVEANAQLIRDGCLYMNGSNTYEEHNEKVELLHTSGVESTYALLKKLSNRQMGPELALRLLSFFVIKHNYDCGIKFGQIPSIHNFNILTLLRHTLVTREYIPDFPDTTDQKCHIGKYFFDSTRRVYRRTLSDPRISSSCRSRAEGSRPPNFSTVWV